MKRDSEFEDIVRKDLDVRAGAEAHDRMRRTVLEAHRPGRETEPARTRETAGRIPMDKPIVKLAVAAAIVAAVVLGLFEFLGSQGTSGVVWAEVAEKLETGGQVTARVQSTSNQPGLPQPIQWEGTIYMAPQLGYRMETFHGDQPSITTIIKNDQQKVLMLMHGSREYTLRSLTPEELAELEEKQTACVNPEGIVDRLLSGHYTKLARKTIDGVEVEGVEIDNPSVVKVTPPVDNHVYTLWVNVETGYPVQTESTITAEDGEVRSRQIVNQIQWNAELDPDLFELTVPPDYTETTEPGF
jgi:outer membrane lipoprotein-sorting protein